MNHNINVLFVCNVSARTHGIFVDMVCIDNKLMLLTRGGDLWNKSQFFGLDVKAVKFDIVRIDIRLQTSDTLLSHLLPIPEKFK